MHLRPRDKNKKRESFARSMDVELLEHEQEKNISLLSNSLSRIHLAANVISNKINEGKDLLTDIEGQVDTTESLLQQNMTRIRKLAESATSTHMCCLFLFFVVVLFLLYGYTKF